MFENFSNRGGQFRLNFNHLKELIFENFCKHMKNLFNVIGTYLNMLEFCQVAHYESLLAYKLAMLVNTPLACTTSTFSVFFTFSILPVSSILNLENWKFSIFGKEHQGYFGYQDKFTRGILSIFVI